MTYVARCHLDPPALGAAPVRFTRTATENMAPTLWAYAAEGWVMRESSTALDATRPSAALTFAAPPACAGRACELVLDADGPVDLVASVDDTPAAVAAAAGSVVVRLPPGTANAWVTFTRRSGEPLGLRVRSLRVVPIEQEGEAP
jgi:hypothetical protein